MEKVEQEVGSGAEVFELFQEQEVYTDVGEESVVEELAEDPEALLSLGEGGVLVAGCTRKRPDRFEQVEGQLNILLVVRVGN